jgi:hypothetical protein
MTAQDDFSIEDLQKAVEHLYGAPAAWPVLKVKSLPAGGLYGGSGRAPPG